VTPEPKFFWMPIHSSPFPSMVSSFFLNYADATATRRDRRSG
jgi:hypothetical protein